MKHIWSVLCRRSIIDNETNNISLNDVLEQLTVGVKAKQQVAPMPEVINIPIDYEVVSLWLRGDEKGHVQVDTEIEIMQPNGKSAKTFPQKIDMPEKIQRSRTRYRINGFVVTMPGRYWFKVKIKEKDGQFKIVSEMPLDINIQKELEVKQ